MKNTLVAFGKRVAELRNKRGITQDRLAEMTGYSTNHIAKLESARTNPSFQLIMQISNALNVEPKELFNFDEYKSPEYIKNELLKIFKTVDSDTVATMYKFYKALKN